MAILIAAIEIGGDGDFSVDCGCVEMSASYTGESGKLETGDLVTAVDLNVRLSMITVEFTATPTAEMIGKTYEIGIKISDNFAETKGSLVIVTE